MRIDILTLFPDTLGDVLSESILGRAQERDIYPHRSPPDTGITPQTSRIRWTTILTAAGGAPSCRLTPYTAAGRRCATRPVGRCIPSICPPAGILSNRRMPFALSKLDNLILVCGHYEGIDQRFIDECVDEEISLGDFVLTGGEIAAMAVADAVCRMVPGVLADPECFEDESHFNGLLEYPQYSRPARMARAGGAGNSALRQSRKSAINGGGSRPLRRTRCAGGRTCIAQLDSIVARPGQRSC